MILTITESSYADSLSNNVKIDIVKFSNDKFCKVTWCVYVHVRVHALENVEKFGDCYVSEHLDVEIEPVG